MEERDIKKILEIIIKRLDNQNVSWQLEGSANLFVQGIDISIRDLDITTNEKYIAIFREYLKDFIVKDYFSEKIKGSSLICNINGFEVEICCYNNKNPVSLENSKYIKWNNLSIPINPLEKALEFYKFINYKDKVKLIEDFLATIPSTKNN